MEDKDLEPGLEQIVKEQGKRLAEKQGVDPRIIDMVLKAPDKFRDLERYFEILRGGVEVASALPQDARAPFSAFMFSNLANLGEDIDPERVATKVATIKETIRALRDDEPNKLLLEKIEKLEQKLAEKEKEEMFNQFSAMLKETIDKVNERHEETLNELTKLKARIDTPPPEPTSIYDKLEKEAESLLNARKKLEELYKILSPEPPRVDESDIIEKLKRQGYKIEPPPDWQTVDRLIDDKIRKVREEARKEAIEELKVQERRESIIVDLVSTVGGAVIDGLRGGGESPVDKKAVKEGGSEWKEKKLGQKPES